MLLQRPVFSISKEVKYAMAKEISKDAKAAENTESKAEVTQEQAPKKGQKPAKGPIYSVSEFVANAKGIFGTRQECVLAALKAAGGSEYTVSEAKEIVEKFLGREVK